MAIVAPTGLVLHPACRQYSSYIARDKNIRLGGRTTKEHTSAPHSYRPITHKDSVMMTQSRRRTGVMISNSKKKKSFGIYRLLWTMPFFSVFVVIQGLVMVRRSFILATDSSINEKQDIIPVKEEHKDENVQVFIGVKTKITGLHGDRMPQIQETWLQDVFKKPNVDLKFFASEVDANNNTLVVTTPGCGKRLCCMDQHMFEYFLEHYNKNGWFCSFDDDNYVIIDNLLRVLHTYQDCNTTNFYIGRPSKPQGQKWKWATLEGNPVVHFLTGGAGYCISSDLMRFGAQHFTNFSKICQSTRLHNDMAIGYVVNNLLGIPQTFDEHFHSHLEDFQKFDLEEIPHQVSFGYNNKVTRQYAAHFFPKIPILHDLETDPMLFKSLRAFLRQGPL